MKHWFWLIMLGAPAAAADAPWQLRESLAPQYASATSPAAVAAARVDLALDAMHADSNTISLPLTDGTRVSAIRHAGQVRDAGDFRWVGHVDADPQQQVVITRVGEHMTAYLSLRDAVYELTPSPQGPLLLKLDTERFPPCAGGIPVASVDADREPAAVMAPSGGPHLIDVLVVFSPASTTQVGGQAAALTFAQGAVDSANLAFDNSQMQAEFRLAGVRFTTRADSGSASTDLGWLRNDPEVAGWRNQVGADLVGMISEFGGSCGVGYLMGNPPGAGFAPSGFQVTARSCAIGNLHLCARARPQHGFPARPRQRQRARISICVRPLRQWQLPHGDELFDPMRRRLHAASVLLQSRRDLPGCCDRHCRSTRQRARRQPDRSDRGRVPGSDRRGVREWF